MRVGLMSLSLIGLACVHVPPDRPMPGASGMDVQTAGMSQMELFEEYESRRFKPTVITRTHVSRTKHSTRVYRTKDRTALAQGGEAFTLAQYLPTLHAEGIAKDIVDPTPYLAEARLISGAWTFAGILAGTYVLTRSIENDSDEEMMNSLSYAGGLYLLGYVGGYVHGMVVSEPGRAMQKRAVKERKMWARTFNLGVAKKLGLGENRGRMIQELAPKKIDQNQGVNGVSGARHK